MNSTKLDIPLKNATSFLEINEKTLSTINKNSPIKTKEFLEKPINTLQKNTIVYPPISSPKLTENLTSDRSCNFL